MKEEVPTSILPYARPEPRLKYKNRIEIIAFFLLLSGVFIQAFFQSYTSLYFMEGLMCGGMGLAVLVLIRSHARSVLAWITLVLSFFFAVMGTTTNF